MSEFTSANLILSKNETVAREYLKEDMYLDSLNAKWCYILTKHDADVDFATGYGFCEEIIALSEKIPVLYFEHSEDHGVGFIILNKGKSISSFYIDWGYLEEISLIIAKEMYGEDEGFNKWLENRQGFDDLAIERENKYLEQVFFENKAHPENFRLFDFSNDDLQKLKNIFSPETIIDPYGYHLVSIIKSTLDIRNLSFTSWHYTNKCKND
ncbi:MAG: hypothetical protein FWH52_01470 [Synergistaceae bacterium]|nr:hypothetical protein [Synergistaceae bacterium]